MDFDTSSEATLVAAAAAGDQEAFVALVGRERSRLWAVCFRITNNRDDAQDALQETLTAAWRGIGSFRGDAKFSTWVYRIATNAATAQSKRRMTADSIDDHDVVAPGDFTHRVVVSDRIADALQQLPESFRATFVLRVYADLSYADIADYQSIPIQTVRSRLSRSKAILAGLLTDLD